MSQVIVLDTHVWVWWVGDPDRLSSNAREVIGLASGNNTLYISSISVWEIVMLSQRGRLSLTMDVGDWIAASEALPSINFVAVNNRIAIRSLQLPGQFHSDPADRIIVATALSLNASLVTMDRKIHDYPHVKALW